MMRPLSLHGGDMPDIIYIDKNDKEITKEKWESLIRDKDYCWIHKFYKDDLYLSASWIGVSWIKSKHHEIWSIAINAIDIDGSIMSVVDFVSTRKELDSEFERVKGLIEEGIIYAEKEHTYDQPKQRKRRKR